MNESQPAGRPDGVNRIVVVAPNWLGDLVMSLPALDALRRAFPGAYVAVVVRRELESLFEGGRWADEVIGHERGKSRMSLRTLLDLSSTLRARRLDLAVLLTNNFESALLAVLAGVPARAGFRRDGRGLLLTHAARPTRESLAGHLSLYYLAMLEQTLGIRGGEREGLPDPSQRELTAMGRLLNQRRRRPRAPLVALAVGASFGPAKRWPATRYAALIDLLADRHDAECVLIGTAKERALCEEVDRASQAGAIVVAGETRLSEAVALLSLCDGFVGNDSGSMHVAAALGVPTVGLFGSTDPLHTGPVGSRAKALYRPLACSPCLSRTCRYGHTQCLAQMQPMEVAGELEGLGAFAGQGRRSARTPLPDHEPCKTWKLQSD